MSSFFLNDVESDKGAAAPSPAAVAAEAPEGSGGGNELNDSLSTPEAEFVVAEKKPLNQTAMMLFLIAAIGGAGTYFMYYRSGPASAKAADPAVVKAEATITDFMKVGSQNVSLLRSLLESTARIVEQFKAYPNMTQVPLSDLKANPFHFAAAKVTSEVDLAEVAKKKKEEERVAILKSVQSLQLQTVVIRGDRKAVMINNTMYQEGDSLESFTVEKITAGGVVVKSGAYRFELRMSK